MLSLKLEASSNGCRYSSDGSRRSFMTGIRPPTRAGGQTATFRRHERSGAPRACEPMRQRSVARAARPAGPRAGEMSEPGVTEIASGLQFPEGPVWMPDGTVLCVELQRRTVDRVHPDGTVEVIAEPGGSPNGLAIGPDGAGYVCNSGGWEFHEVFGMTITHLIQ